jgi:hypothetical protein
MLQSTFGNFHGIFVIFGVFFVPCKHFLEFPNLFLRWKIFRKKQKSSPSGWAEPEGPTRIRSGPTWPAEAHRPTKAEPAATAALAVACVPRQARPPDPIKGEPPRPRVP